ncbi:hypothetical protein D1646_00620 [Pseudoflavonifractor sp. 60]|nr:hypothetical protein [Pseudoflavonifractor sp. 60]
MNNEERILQILERQEKTLEKHGEMLEKHGEMLEKHGEMLEKLTATVDRIQIDVSGIKVRLDVEVKQQFDLLAEGQQIIRETMVPQSRVEELEADVSVLKTAVRMLSQDVAELKKAQ